MDSIIWTIYLALKLWDKLVFAKIYSEGDINLFSSLLNWHAIFKENIHDNININ